MAESRAAHVIDCVASLHTNQWTCGVARFNAQLAQRLGVPLVSLADLLTSIHKSPLLSLKFAELPPCPRFWRWCREHSGRFDVLCHDEPRPVVLGDARLVYVANQALAGPAHNACGSSGKLLWCPSTVPIADLSPMTRIITFGMAHKLALRSYKKLRDLLGDQPYALGVSMAMHDGQAWDENMAALEAILRPVFGARLHMFGYLADAALSATLQTATAAALLFADGVRANNTTLWAALEHGCPVITNLDAWSPPELVHDQTVFNINELTRWPTAAQFARVSRLGKDVARLYSWDRLVEAIRG